MTKPERIQLHTLLEKPRNRKKIEQIAEAVKRGAVFVYPTETIYGLGGACTIPEVKKKILAAKQRPADQPMILIAPDRTFFSKLPIVFPPPAERLARVFWPGMLTMVLPSMNTERGVAVRVSRHPFIKALFRYIDQPLFSTSANRGGEAYVNDPDLIYSIFFKAIDFFIDAGPLPLSPPSTVVKIGNNNMVTVLREGAVSLQDIFAALH
jgi:L-threonylcarbamoyladenylate synthase